MTKNDILDRIELRQSTLQTYLKCPKLFEMKHLLKMESATRHSALIFGTALHEVIHRLHTESWDMDYMAAYDEATEKAIAGEDTPVFWKDDPDRLRETASEILAGYRDNPANRQAKVLFSETPFRVKIHGHTFTGTIDQVRLNPDGTIELIDIKSSKQKPTLAFLMNDIQLNLYLYALVYGELRFNGIWVKTGLLPDFAGWYFLRSHELYKRKTANGNIGEQKGEPLIRTQRGIEDLKQFKEELKPLLKGMLSGKYYANANHCQMCSMAGSCLGGTLGAAVPDSLKELVAELESA